MTVARQAARLAAHPAHTYNGADRSYNLASGAPPADRGHMIVVTGGAGFIGSNLVAALEGAGESAPKPRKRAAKNTPKP